MSTSTPRRAVPVRYEIPATRDDWTLSEEPVPESQPHDLALDLLKALLLGWVGRLSLNAQVARNLAVRWDQAMPKTGVDPDLCVISPCTPEGDELESLCLWREGHTPPLLAIEVVSSHPRKDYAVAPDKYAASGTHELWIFDPKRAGPKAHGGPFRLQVWVRDADGGFSRSYAGEGPACSPAVGAWLFAVHEGQRLRIAQDEEGTQWWTTPEEAERIAKETERAAKEAERTAKEAALAAKDAERAAKEAERIARDAERAAKEAERTAKEAALAAKDAERAAKETALARVAELEAELARRSSGRH